MEGAALGRRQQPSEGIGWGSWDRLGRFVILVWFWMIGGGEGDELELGRMETTAYARTAEGDQTKQTETRLQLVFFSPVRFVEKTSRNSVPADLL